MGLFRSVATVGGYTMVSRVLGFAREILTAAMLGAGPLSDAFFVALRLPNLFRSLFAEGAFAQAFVPIFSGTLARDGRRAAVVFARDTFAVLLLALCLFLCAGEVFTPAILHLVAPGFERDPAQFRLVGEPDAHHLSLSAVHLAGLVPGRHAQRGGQVRRQCRQRLAAEPVPDRAPCCSSAPLTDQALAWAVSLSGLAQFAWLAWSCGRAGLLAAPAAAQAHRGGCGALLRIMLPGVFGAGATQINIMVSHRDRLAGAERVGFVPVLCRPAETSCRSAWWRWRWRQ